MFALRVFAGRFNCSFHQPDGNKCFVSYWHSHQSLIRAKSLVMENMGLGYTIELHELGKACCFRPILCLVCKRKCFYYSIYVTASSQQKRNGGKNRSHDLSIANQPSWPPSYSSSRGQNKLRTKFPSEPSLTWWQVMRNRPGFFHWKSFFNRKQLVWWKQKIKSTVPKKRNFVAFFVELGSQKLSLESFRIWPLVGFFAAENWHFWKLC